MQKIVYALGTLAAVLFALSGGFFATGYKSPAIWFLCAGIFFSFLSAAIHWLDNTPKAESSLNLSILVPETLSMPPAPNPPRPKSQRVEPDKYEPDERDREILWYLFQSNVDRNLGSIVRNLRFEYSEEAVSYLEKLTKHGYVRLPPRWSVMNQFPEYALTPKGRDYVVKNLLPMHGDI